MLFELNPNHFLIIGIATLKIRVSFKNAEAKLLTLKIKLVEPADNLMTLLSHKLELTDKRIKLIASGRVLDSQKSLSEQNVKNFQQILAVETSEEEGKNDDKNYSRIAKIRKDAEVLLKNKNSDYFKV